MQGGHTPRKHPRLLTKGDTTPSCETNRHHHTESIKLSPFSLGLGARILQERKRYMSDQWGTGGHGPSRSGDAQALHGKSSAQPDHNMSR
jgi:hypothetical protein